ncbi:MAG: stage II sporulation protein M [Clostridia bacterium]|nr:stage II sporulation protein M [Clostridia bacterium]
MIIGVLFINNVEQEEQEEISTYINSFIEKSKSDTNINYTKLFFSSIRNNITLAIILWFAGLTVIGIFAVYGMVCYRGFTLGYSISCIVATLGAKNGGIFILSSMLLQNIIFIPVLFALSISGIRLYKSIMKDRGKENIKLEILRHTIFSAILSIMLIVASFIETYVSTNIFMLTLNIL